MRVWRPWGGTTWVPSYGGATTATTVEAPVAPAEPAARDPMLGESAGVRVVGTIGLPPREPRAARGSPGTPIGTVVIVEEEEEAARSAIRGVVSFDAGYVLHEVARGTLSARLELPASIDLVLGYAGYFEPTGAGFDAIAIGRLGIGVRLVDEEVARLRLAASARHFHDWLGPLFGVEAMLGTEIDVYDATVLAIEASLGTLGETFAAQIRVSLGVRPIDAVEIYAGYDHLVLQPFDGESRPVELGGPMAGVRVVVE